jgi:hypothetical protein
MTLDPLDQPTNTDSNSTRTGKIFAIGIGMLCLMVIASVGLMFVAAMKDADNRARHPVIGQP